MGFVIRHKLSNSAATDLLSLINFHVPKRSQVPISMFLLEKSLGLSFKTAKKHYVCEDCSCRLVETSNSFECEKCCREYTSTYLLKLERYFFTFDIRSSLHSLLQETLVKLSLQKSLEKRSQSNQSGITDIMDGSAYRNLQLSGSDITCCMNTDGVTIFNSSRFSIWPLLISINELEYKIRRKYTLLVGLWFGESKPNFNIFLEAFVSQCRELSKDGVKCDVNDVHYNSKVFFPMFAADSVARCQIQGINQFNGEYSCPWCLAKGETMWLNEICHKWVFNPRDQSAPRTHVQFISHLKDVQKVLQTGKNSSSVFGVKSASLLILLPKFDIIDGFVFDYMHTCLLGIVRTFTCAWLDSKYHDKPFYIGKKSSEIDSRIKNCKLPFECQRTVRELKDVKYWKAHEWKTWMIIAVPLLKGILSDCFVKHFSKFARAIYILSKRTISTEELEISAKLVEEFCNLIPDLYGLSFCTFNIHLASHVVDCVRKWGPLWAYSLFQFENYNGVLGKNYMGTTFVGLQIVKKIQTAEKLLSLGQTSVENTVVKDFFVSMINRQKFYSSSLKVGSYTLLGSKKPYEFSNREKQQLTRIGITCNSGICYCMCVLYRKIYYSCNRDIRRRVNSFVQINSKIYIVQRFITAQDYTTVVVLVKKVTTIEHPILPFSYKVIDISDTTKFFNINDVDDLKFIVIYDMNEKLDVVIPLANTVECE